MSRSNKELLAQVKSITHNIYDLIVPRFITEDCAVEELEDSYHVVMPMSCLYEGERYDGIATMQSFTWLGMAFFAKQVGDIRPWELWTNSTFQCHQCSHKYTIVHEVGHVDRSCPECGSLQAKQIEVKL